jgi:hypothetical protein
VHTIKSTGRGERMKKLDISQHAECLPWGTPPIDRVILGPSFLSSPLARGTILRMLDVVGKSELKDRIKSSTIPFRAP